MCHAAFVSTRSSFILVSDVTVTPRTPLKHDHTFADVWMLCCFWKRADLLCLNMAVNEVSVCPTLDKWDGSAEPRGSGRHPDSGGQHQLLITTGQTRDRGKQI